MSEPIDFYFDFSSPYGYFAATQIDAIARGVFGSPYIVVDGEPFWGADRLGQLERWLESGGW